MRSVKHLRSLPWEGLCYTIEFPLTVASFQRGSFNTCSWYRQLQRCLNGREGEAPVLSRDDLRTDS